MALVETLIDTFDSYSGIGPTFGPWTNTSANAFLVMNNDTATFSSQTTSQYTQIVTANPYVLQGSAAFVQVKSAGNQAITSHETIFYVSQDSAGSEDFNNKMYITINSGSVTARKVIGGVNTVITSSITYDSVAHRWIRIRESGGTTYVDFSPNGKVWTNQWNFANVITVSTNHFALQEGTFSNEALTTTSVFDNFNYRTQMLLSTNLRPHPFSPGLAR